MERNPEARSCSSSRCPELLHSDTSITVSIHSTTGSRFELSVPPEETVDGLKRRLAEKLRVPKDRLLLLHRDARLSSGKLLDYGVMDGSRLTLMPAVEAGLMSQSWRPEQSVLQALESLTDAQVSDFLSGRSPLTLALRVGDHMMFVQLQLANQPSVSRAHNQSDAQPSTGPAPPAPHTGHTHSDQSPAPSPAQADRQRCKPGAVIESLVNHAPGVFSGTFSGTLHPNCQDGSGRPRRDISTILQILNDLLSATRYYQGPPTLAHLSCRKPRLQATPTSHLVMPTSPPATPTSPPVTPTSPPPSPTSDGHGRLRRPSGECLRQTENRATRCKVEHLRLLLRQRRLRRRARRDTRGPYPRAHTLTHTHTHSSDMDFEEPVWKPDLNTEFVVA
ncbi:midnolin-A-like [Pseudorasbora parva]|uniref:midnolin-A-like n=1 Tax=Pseudorasbora parva TaxID=51549 RepID=UPI00351F43B8